MEIPIRLPISEYLLRPVRTLRTACLQAGRDDEGRACLICPVRDLCELPALRAEQRAVSRP